MSVLACNICLRKDELKKQTQVDRLVKIVSSNYHDDEEQDILTVGMMIIRLNVDGEESNLRLASWFSLSTSSQAIGRLPSPSTCPLRLALRLIKIEEIVSFCILSSWCKIIQPAPSMKTRDKFCPLLKCQKVFLWNHLRLARFFWFFTSLGKRSETMEYSRN